MKLKIVLYLSEEGYAVGVPSLPGCWSQGETKEEAMANIIDAIHDYLEAEIPQEEGAEFEEIEVLIKSWRNCPGSTT
jgi:predicted RNase H-like HicB family nuclease